MDVIRRPFVPFAAAGAGGGASFSGEGGPGGGSGLSIFACFTSETLEPDAALALRRPRKFGLEGAPLRRESSDLCLSPIEGRCWRVMGPDTPFGWAVLAKRAYRGVGGPGLWPWGEPMDGFSVRTFAGTLFFFLLRKNDMVVPKISVQRCQAKKLWLKKKFE